MTRVGGNDMSFTQWRVVRQGETDAALVALDFGIGRPGAGMGDLAQRLSFSGWILESRPPAQAGMTVDRYVDELLADLRSSDLMIRGVLGYCAGSNVAGMLHRRLTVEGDLPLVLLDPARVTAETLRAEFVTAVRTLAQWAVEAGAPTEALLPVRDPSLDLDPAELDDIAAALHVEYARLARETLQELKMPAKVAEQLATRVATYLRYLALCGRVEESPGDVAMCIHSRAVPPCGRDGVDCLQPAVELGELFLDRDVAALVDDRVG